MRNIKMILTIMVAIAALPCLSADAAELKIGVVDFQEVLTGSEPGKQFEAEMRKEGQQIQAEIEQSKEELKALKEKLEREAMVMSEKAKEEKQIEFNVKLSSLKKKDEQFRKDFMSKQRQEVSRFQRDVLEIAHEIGKKEKYSLIISKEALLYMDGAVDITPKVIQAINKRHQSQGKQ